MSTITIEHARALSNLGGVASIIAAMRSLTDDVPFDPDEVSGLALVPTNTACTYIGSLAEDLEVVETWVAAAIDTLLNLHDELAAHE